MMKKSTKERDLLDGPCDIYLAEGITANHLMQAVIFNYPRIAMALMKHPNWYDFLRVTFVFDNNNTTPFREMIKKMPDVAEFVLDKCIVDDPYHKNKRALNFSVLMNYEFLEDFASPSQAHVIEKLQVSEGLVNLDIDVPWFYGHNCSYTKLKEEVKQKSFSTEWGPVRFTKENHPLSIMVRNKRERLLNHPVVGSLLHSKWITFGQYSYYLDVLTYCLFLGFLTTYSMIIRNPLDSICQCAEGKNCSLSREDANSTSTNYGTSRTTLALLYVSSIIVIVVAVGRLIVITLTLITIKRNNTHAYNWEHNFVKLIDWINKLILYTSAIAFVVFFKSEFQCLVVDWQWPFGVLSVTLGWINLIIFISKFPFLGIYVLILLNVFVTFMKVILLSSLLVIAFGLAFYMTFREPDILRSPFSTPVKSILKMVTMATGEFEFDSIFRHSPNGDSDLEEVVPYEFTASVLWIVFIIVMPILLTNMLVGLAVGDIGKIRGEATLTKLGLQVGHVLSIEEAFRNKPFKWIFSLAWREVWPNSTVTSISATDVNEFSKMKRFWKRLRSFIDFASLEGKRYNSLSSILKLEDPTDTCAIAATKRVSAEVADIKQRLQTNLATIKRSLSDEVEDLKQQLQATIKRSLTDEVEDIKQQLQTNQEELTKELKNSHEDLKRAINGSSDTVC